MVEIFHCYSIRAFTCNIPDWIVFEKLSHTSCSIVEKYALEQVAMLDVGCPVTSIGPDWCADFHPVCCVELLAHIMLR